MTEPTNIGHLLAELERLRLFLQAQVWRARQLAGVDEGLHAFYIPEAEVDAKLAKPVGQPFWNAISLPDETAVSLQKTLNTTEAHIATLQEEAARMGVLLRLERLTKLFDLTTFDRDVLLVALAPEFDLSFQRLYAYLHDDVTRKLPTVGLLLDLFGIDVLHKTILRQRFSPTNPLLRERLITLHGESGQPQLAHAMSLDPRIASYLLESNAPDRRLTPFLKPVDPTNRPPALPRPFLNQLDAWLQTRSKDAPLLLYLQGADGAGKRALAAQIAESQRQPLLMINGRLLSQQPDNSFATLLPLILRESRLQGAALLWTDWDAYLHSDQRVKREMLLQQLNGRSGLTMIAGTKRWEPSGSVNYETLTLVLPTLSVAERTAQWMAVLANSPNSLNENDFAELAAKFRLTSGQIKAAVQTARAHAQWRNPAAPHLTLADLIEASRRHSNQLLADLAQKIIHHHDWNDLVLPDLQQRQLRELCNQVNYRGRVYQEWGFDQKLSLGKGINALFSGPPGTGKTMAAGILARELGLDLYKIDLSTVVSKFVGETEKNLSRIFSEAESSNAILFFDEADALFGKRTEVRNSHDRYANLEISYLLQRMEQYDGIVILASNLRKNMDEAFVRRMHFIVEFPFPAVGERKRIWQSIWPDALPKAEMLDLDLLAEKVEVAGGNIRNIAVTAAFLAAANGQQLTMSHVEQATLREFQKMGKVLHRSLLPRE